MRVLRAQQRHRQHNPFLLMNCVSASWQPPHPGAPGDESGTLAACLQAQLIKLIQGSHMHSGLV